MRSSQLLSFAILGATSVLGQTSATTTTSATPTATVITNNPIGREYSAELPKKSFASASSLDGNIHGSLRAITGPGGRGVDYVVEFSNLPTAGGPFLYHIHVARVPENGNCTATGAHLDPTGRGDTTPCDSSNPASCQVGDLSGKYGQIKSDPFTATYHDDFASMNEGDPAFIGNRSFVIHFQNTTRITCANLVEKFKGTTNTTGAASSTTGGIITATSTLGPVVTAGAGSIDIPTFAKFAALAPLAILGFAL